MLFSKLLNDPLRAAVLIAAFAGLTAAFIGFSVPASSQNAKGSKGERNVSREGDADLAAEIRRLADRSTIGLYEEMTDRGGTMVDLQGRFMNVPLMAIDEMGRSATYCVTSLEEANEFFGRDLETGRPLSGKLAEFRTDAAYPGMSKAEVEFYRNMIEAFVERQTASPEAATITIVNNDGAGEGFNDPTPVSPVGGNEGTTLGQQRLNVFNFAANIWASFLDSSVNIQVRSQFDPLTCTPTSAVLGSAGAVTVHNNFTGAVLTNTWYSQALANKQAGVDLSASPDINATFNSNLNGSPGCLGGRTWYMGFNNTTPSNTTNLLVVLLHEMAHGLGFQSFANGTTGALFNGLPDAYTTNMFDRTVNLGWNEMTNTQRAASALNSSNLLWNGPNVRLASGFLQTCREAATGRVQLFAPATFQSGSSVSHFDTACFPNLLMEPSITLNLPLDLDLTRQQMRDIGWFRDANNDGVPDTITNVTPSGGVLSVGSNAVINWTNTSGFTRNVTIELSTDGGATYPVTIATNIANTGSHSFTVPNLPTAQAKVRVREHNFVDPVGVSAANFAISADIEVSGRVLTPSGQGLRSATVILTDSTGASRNITTSSFGFFRFDNINAGENYTLTVVSRTFRFNPTNINTNTSIFNLDITGVE
ncbi:MAG: carboxypeptidase regulatory-like domain-containing protein [Acidobacteriota bacterium]|nr:MAG: carboxypeptidase regulatory-like domain-containing protein [Acidobacteriota bacterium]